MSRELGKREVFDFVKRVCLGTVSGLLMKLGVAFLIFGMWDVAIYFFDSYVMEKDVVHPGDSFGWSQYFGLSCFLVGLAIKLFFHFKDHSAKLRADRLWLKENYLTLSDARLQDEFERLYKIKNADVRAINNVLSHPHNKNMVIEMFTACHLNVIPKDEWFIEKGSYLTLRYNVGFVFWLLLPITIVLALILATVEYFVPGASNSGPYAVPGFVALAALTALGAKLLFNDISALAQATALVHEYRP